MLRFIGLKIRGVFYWKLVFSVLILEGCIRDGLELVLFVCLVKVWLVFLCDGFWWGFYFDIWNNMLLLLYVNLFSVIFVIYSVVWDVVGFVICGFDFLVGLEGDMVKRVGEWCRVGFLLSLLLKRLLYGCNYLCWIGFWFSKIVS